MRQHSIVLRISILFLAFPLFFFGQYDTAFYNYLNQSNLHYERLALNKKILATSVNKIEAKDHLLLDRAYIFMQLQLPDSSRACIKKITSSASFNPLKQHVYYSMLLVNNELAPASDLLFLRNNTNDIFLNDLAVSLQILKRELKERDSLPNAISVSLNEIKSHYQSFSDRSPSLAGLYSAILPGAGKYYLGYKKQALTSFIVNTLLAAQATESFVKDGAKSYRFIITAGVFGIFYSGNIWGSVAAAKKRKRDFYLQTDHEVYNYYTHFIYDNMR
jgi:hypothetical protein